MELLIGERVDAPLTTRGTALAWERVVVTENRALGRAIGALDIEDSHGVRISRVSRAGAELVARGDLALQFGDIVTVVGPHEGIDAVRAVLGDQAGRLQEVRFDALFAGVAAGVLLGSIPLALPGLPAPVKLGLAGGPLIAAILLARLGRLGPLVWFMPPTANHALRELGIALFLAVVGIRAGAGFLDTLLQGDGLVWVGYGALVTLAPLVVVGLVARLVLRIDHDTLCGALAGSMTDPPALAFANAQSPGQAPALAYASVYPLAMCLRILAAQVLVLTLA
jgi:putative transport protein